MNRTKLTLWLLVASLALNVFLAVTFGPHMLRPPRPPQPPRPERIIEEMAETLPAADAVILRGVLASKRESIGTEGDDPRQYHERLRSVLTAEPFNPAAFAQLASEFRAKRERFGDIVTDILAEALPRMSAEGRKALADFRPPPPPRR